MDENQEMFIKASVIRDKTDLIVGSFNKRLNDLVKRIRLDIHQAKDQGQYSCSIIAPDPQFHAHIIDLLRKAEYIVTQDVIGSQFTTQKWCISWGR